MAKILDSNTITGAIQKVVETPTGYIINGHFYDKVQMIPKPFKLFPTLGDATDLSMSRKLLLGSTVANHFKTQGDTIVSDRYDSTISYVWVIGARNSTAQRLLKIKENNGDVSLVTSNVYTSVPTSNPLVRAYCGQDSNYLYYIISCSQAYTEFFVKVDKTTLAMTVIENLSNYSWGSVIKENATHIYYGRKQGYGTNILKRYNKTTSTIDTFSITAKTSNIYFSTCFSQIVSNSDTSFYTYSLSHNSSTNKFGVVRYAFDTAQTTLDKVCTEADMNITWGSITQFPVFASNPSVTYEPFITTASNGDKYFNVAVYENACGSTSVNIPSYGILTFALDNSSNTLTFKNFVQVTADYFRGFIGTKSNTFLVCASSTTTIFMSFNEANEKFVITDTISNQPSHIGIDQAENIWIVNALGEVEYLNPFVPTNINVAYEKSAYKYEGTDMTTFCTVSCQNYSGNYIAGKLQLTLKGNAVFTSNSSKVITVDTLSTDVLKVSIKITGAGSLTVYPQLVM
ncbi:hypothetical protein CLPUN_53330 [Clostridium puniceum]|uniref:Uncharacterized protein n=1 Tax=Clostridium puniceum TaxID=29367 RepID=A0A1S8SX70_9CLOT|nr:hypothetical protein [Clostridium puniceum]OOM70001.1 hypothetical protein CLPUN_53330 [Clostridium puniceum]